MTLRSNKRKSLLREKRSSLFKIIENEDKPASNLQNTEIVKCEIQQCLTDISDLMPDHATQTEKKPLQIDMHKFEKVIVTLRTKLIEHREFFLENEFIDMFDQEDNIKAMRMLIDFIESSCNMIE